MNKAIYGAGSPGILLCPDPRATVLLADTGIVLEPPLNLPAFWQMAYVSFECASEVFFESLNHLRILAGCCGRPVMRENDSRARSAEMPRSE